MSRSEADRRRPPPPVPSGSNDAATLRSGSAGSGDSPPAARAPQRLRGAPRPWDCCFAACGCCFANASTRSCRKFIAATRSQQALLLLVGCLSFWACFPLYVLSFKAFAVGLTVGSMIFTLGLVYDVRMISETEDAANAARAFMPALADVLVSRSSWRWWAFAFNLTGGALTLLGCIFYLEAAWKTGPMADYVTPNVPPDLPRGAGRDVWLGNAVFAGSLYVFAIGFAVLASDAVATMREVAVVTGAPEPGPYDETKMLLLAFLASLTALGVGNTLILFPYKWVLPPALICFLGGATVITVAAWWQLRSQWRDFSAGAGSFWDAKALEEAAIAAQKGSGGSDEGKAGKGLLRGSKLGSLMSFGRRGGQDEEAGPSTPLLGDSGASLQRGALATRIFGCCFRRGAGEPVADEDDAVDEPPQQDRA